MGFAKKMTAGAFAVVAAFALALCLMAASATTAHAATAGWKLTNSDTKLVYVQKDGTKAANQTIDGIKLGADGYAKSNTASKLKIAVMKKIKKLTKPGMTREQKLRACFNYNMVQDWWNVEPSDYGEEGWMARFALSRINGHRGECFTFAVLNAYYAYELGYKPVLYCQPNCHAFVMIGDLALDNMYGGVFMGAPKNSKKGMKKWVITSWSTTSPKGVTKTQKFFQSKKGLVKYKGHYYFVKNGKPVKNVWKKVKGKKYYFNAKGRAVTGAYQINEKWYVFSAKGKLLTGKKTREVKVSGVRYRVKKNGRAAKGWNAAHTRYFLASGAQAKGLCCTGATSVAAFSATGSYQAAQTTELQKLVCVNDRAEDLIDALSAIETPKVENFGASCSPLIDELGVTGVDCRYTYSHLVLDVFQTEDGLLYLEGISAC